MWTTFSPYKVEGGGDGGEEAGENVNKLSREDWTNLISPKRSRYDTASEDISDVQCPAEGGTETDTGSAVVVSHSTDNNELGKDLEAHSTDKSTVSVEKQVTQDTVSFTQGEVTTTKIVTTTITTTHTSSITTNGILTSETKDDVIISAGISSESSDGNNNIQEGVRGDALLSSSSLDSTESVNAFKEKLAARKNLNRVGLLTLKETLMGEAVKVANAKNSNII